METITFPAYFPVACHTDHVGPESTFVVIRGMKDDGMRHIPLALQKGARMIVIEKNVSPDAELLDLISKTGAKIERVEDARLALAERAAQALEYPATKLAVIGITGTKGKTTTAFLTEHMLKTAGYKTALISTVENHILDQKFPAPLTTPQPDYIHVFLDLCVKAGVECVVMETSAQAFTLHRVAGIRFDLGIMTNFSQEHAEFYKTNDEYFAAKKAILKHLKPGAPLLLNADDSRVAALADEYEYALLFDGTGTHEANLQAILELSTVKGITGQVSYIAAPCCDSCECDEEPHVETYKITAPALMGAFNLANIAAVALCGILLEIPSDIMARAFETFPGVPGRLNRYELPNNISAFIDYAHTPSSFDAVLGTLRQLTDQLIVVFGAGGERDPIKRPQMGSIAARIADTVILTTDNPRSENAQDITRDIMAGIDRELASKVCIEPDREEAIKKAYSLARSGAVIALLGKGPDEYQLVVGKKIYFSEREILERLMRKDA